jgi:hypothetical protein
MAMLKRMQVQIALVALMTLSLASPPGAGARLIEDVYFSPRVTASGVPMVLNGVGLKKLWQVVKVSVAALYLGDGVSPSTVLSNVPKRFEIEYFHAISAKDFVELIENAVSSNRIEGAEVDPSRIATIVFGQPLLRDRDEEEVRGYRQALTWIHEQGSKLPISEETVLQLHRMTRGEIWDAGEYKE